MTEVIDFDSTVSLMSPVLGVHVSTGGRMGQGARAEQFKVTGVPSSTSSLDGVRVGPGRESRKLMYESDKIKTKKMSISAGIVKIPCVVMRTLV